MCGHSHSTRTFVGTRICCSIVFFSSSSSSVFSIVIQWQWQFSSIVVDILCRCCDCLLWLLRVCLCGGVSCSISIALSIHIICRSSLHIQIHHQRTRIHTNTHNELPIFPANCYLCFSVVKQEWNRMRNIITIIRWNHFVLTLIVVPCNRNHSDIFIVQSQFSVALTPHPDCFFFSHILYAILLLLLPTSIY